MLAVACYQPRRDPLPVTDPARADGGGSDQPVRQGGSGGGSDSTGTGGAGPPGPANPADGPFRCEEGAPCAVPESPCLQGETTCGGATITCVKTNKPQANGTECGSNSVCLDGVCSPCSRGASCAIPDKPCRKGALECSSGKPQCEETGNAANGADCGAGMACQEGTCVACQAGAACVPTNPCHKGTLACTAGAPTCNDTGASLPPGTACATNRVCNAAGQCVDCVASAACDPGSSCKTGKTDCTSGAPVCVESGNATNGKDCGPNQVCSDGRCADCSAGMSCTPNNRCHVGTLSCSTGSAMCTDTGTNAPNGTSCGTNLYCSNGSCTPCTPEVACSTGNPCKTGSTICSTGTSQCRETGNAPSGRDCGNGRVCNAGSCVDCNANQPCEAAACKVGMTSCSTGASRCVETGNAANGRSCGNNRVCNNGSCVACNEGDSCSPGDACKRGTISCRTGSPVCAQAGNANDGTGCGGTRVCIGGACRDCNPNSAPFCRNGQLVSCSANGSETTNNCGGNGCSAGRCNECRPNARDCSGTSVRTCRSSGTGYDTTPCPGKTNGRATCSGGTCSFECDSGFMKDGGSCVPQCGRSGQLCCGPNDGGPNDRCNSGLRCSGGIVGQRRCTDCGRMGGACCNDLVGCNAGSTCEGDVCVPL
jgi:hypothetical protein